MPPLSDLLLRLDRAPPSSDEGLPLANGLLGALVWGDGAPLNISLDRTDLWDLRSVPEFSAADYRLSDVAAKHRAGAHDELIERLEKPYYRAGPTKIPAGRIELVVDGARFDVASLDPSHPVGCIALGEHRVRVLVHATDLVGVIWVDAASCAFGLKAPAFGGKPADWQAPSGFDASHADVWDLGYGAPALSDGPTSRAFVQQCHGGMAFAVHVEWRLRGPGHVAAWSIATSAEGSDPLTIARDRVLAALAEDEDALLARHRDWWSNHWLSARVVLPDAALARTYALDMYKFGAAARSGVPPVSLQGPWTVDNGRLPPWKGDYHHDLNTQMSYWPALAGNQVDAHAGFLAWLFDTRDACRTWTRQYFEVSGLNVPMTADLLNRQIGGWRQYTHSLASGAWLSHHFRQHWRYTRDQSFLEDRAYPYAAEVCAFIDAITAAKGADGHRTVALSSSPEIHGNSPAAWFDRLTNYDLSMFRHALTSAAEMADELGFDDGHRWRAVAAELPALAVADDDVIEIAPGERLAESHRHFSHLAAIFPLGDIDPWRSPEEARIARASIDQLDTLGSGMWMGYSFAWLACLKARIGDGDGALAALRAYAEAFLLPNSFHANGDFGGKGYSNAVFRAFTLEGNFGAAQAVHELLLQSHNGTVRLFPALPSDWRDAAFERLLAEGAVSVTATVAGGTIVAVALCSPIAQRCRLAAGRSDICLAIDLPKNTAVSLDQVALRTLNTGFANAGRTIHD